MSVGIATLTAPALDAHYIAGVSGHAPLWILQQMQTQDVWLFLAVRTALTPSAVQLEEVRSRLRVCRIPSCSERVHPECSSRCCSTAPAPVVLSMGTQTGWGREPGEHRTRDPFACSARGDFQCTALWLHDEAMHDGFPMLSRVLLSENVDVCCIQETNAGDLTTFPVDQPYTCDGLCGSRGREAAFLIREGVVSTPIPGVQDSVSMRWALLASLCVSAHSTLPILASM